MIVESIQKKIVEAISLNELSRKKKNKARLDNIKYYHVSRRRLKPGTILLPGNELTGNNTHAGQMVFMNDNPTPHETILSKIEKSKKEWHVYEVQPLSDVEVYPFGEYEYGTDKAKIVRYIGNAQGIAQNRSKRNLKKLKKANLKGVKRRKPDWMYEIPQGANTSRIKKSKVFRDD